MRSVRKVIIIMMVLMLGTCLLLEGCTTAKKPYTPTPTPQTSNKTTQVTPPAPTTTTTNTTQVASRSATEANKEAGVNKATAVITGKTMYIGLNLDANIEKAKAVEVEKNVTNRVKKMEPNYTIMVTSDVDTVTRIKNVSQGIAQGRPISSFSQELQTIGSRIKPMVK